MTGEGKERTYLELANLQVEKAAAIGHKPE